MKAASIERVLVAGAGESGVQIALQFARFGFQVDVVDLADDRLRGAQKRQGEILHELTNLDVIADGQADQIRQRIRLTADLEHAARSAQLVSESITEDLEAKRKLFAELNRHCPADAILTTNTSYLLPSRLTAACGRPDRLCAFHFHVPVWFANAVDIMPHPRTAPEVVDALRGVALRINQVPILLHRENPGYVFNAMLHPLLMAGMDLAAREVADLHDVDRAWMAVTKMPAGPFGIIDKIGIDTVHKIVEQWAALPGNKQAIRVMRLLAAKLEQGRLGEKSGAGFYDYPRPEYARDAFLSSHEVGRQAPAVASKPAPGQATQRFVPTLVPAPVNTRLSHQLELSGRALIIGGTEDAASVVTAWKENGAAVVQWPDESPPENPDEWMRAQFELGPITHLTLVAPDEDLPAGEDQRSLDRWIENRFELPFVLLQSWFTKLVERDLIPSATFLSTTRTSAMRPSFSYCGLAKALSMDAMSDDGVGMAVRDCTFPMSMSSELCARQALTELALAQREPVIGDVGESRRRQANVSVDWTTGQRSVWRLKQDDVPIALDAIAPRGTWVVSGGASGIGLTAMLELAHKHRLQLHLLGRTPLPQDDYLDWPQERLVEFKAKVMREAYHRGTKPNEAWAPYEKAIQLQNGLRRYEDAGVNVQYHVCDVADREAVQAIFDRLEQQGIGVNGILHAAGVEQTARLEVRRRDVFQATVRPKVLGAVVLHRAARRHPIESFVAFGSLAGQLGGVGQTDYVFANDAMSRLISDWNRREPNCRYCTIDWPGWEETGMAARPSSKFMLERLNHRLMPVSEGIQHFRAEIENRSPVDEIVIGRSEELSPEFLA